jgi:hypothetical protein
MSRNVGVNIIKPNRLTERRKREVSTNKDSEELREKTKAYPTVRGAPVGIRQRRGATFSGT